MGARERAGDKANTAANTIQNVVDKKCQMQRRKKVLSATELDAEGRGELRRLVVDCRGSREGHEEGHGELYDL